MKRFPILKIINAPNLVTLLSAMLGVAAALLCVAGHMAAGLAVYAFTFLCDKLDGLLARRLRKTSAEGVQLDSLADFWCFSVLPGLLGFLLARQNFWVLPGALAMAACGALRLAYFNVHGMEEGDIFLGMPTTMAAAFCFLLMVLGQLLFPALPAPLCAFAQLAAAAAMVSGARIDKNGVLSKALYAVVPLAGVLALFATYA